MINDTKVMDSVREILAGTMPAEVKCLKGNSTSSPRKTLLTMKKQVYT